MQLRHVALHARAVDEDKPQRDPVEVEGRQALLRRKLGAAIGIGRLRREILRQHMVRRRSGLGADGRQEDEALGACPLRRACKADRGLGIEHAIVVFRQSRHGVGETGRVNDRIDVGQRRRHVLRPREIADHGARGVHRHRAWASQQDTQPVAALGQFPQQTLPDEAGRAGEGDERSVGRADGVHCCSPASSSVRCSCKYIALPPDCVRVIGAVPRPDRRRILLYDALRTGTIAAILWISGRSRCWTA